MGPLSWFQGPLWTCTMAWWGRKFGTIIPHKNARTCQAYYTMEKRRTQFHTKIHFGQSQTNLMPPQKPMTNIQTEELVKALSTTTSARRATLQNSPRNALRIKSAALCSSGQRDILCQRVSSKCACKSNGCSIHILIVEHWNRTRFLYAKKTSGGGSWEGGST